MWTREEFRKFIAGHFALMVGTDKDTLTKYVEGGVFAFDQLMAKNGKEVKEAQLKEIQDEQKLN